MYTKGMKERERERESAKEMEMEEIEGDIDGECVCPKTREMGMDNCDRSRTGSENEKMRCKKARERNRKIGNSEIVLTNDKDSVSLLNLPVKEVFSARISSEPIIFLFPVCGRRQGRERTCECAG